MTLTYELCAKLKAAGFEQPEDGTFIGEDGLMDADHYGHFLPYVPTLAELIDACGEGFVALSPYHGLKKWGAHSEKKEFTGKTKEEAVARLYLELNSNLL